MSSYGVTAAGFVRKPLETILSEIETDQKAALGAGFDVSVQSPEGQINGTVATQLDELWEVAEAVYSSIDPDKATDTALAAAASLSGTVRQAATKSTVTATVNLDAGKTLAAGAIASVSGSPDARFVTTVAVTNGGGAPADVSVAMEAETAGVVIANAGTLTVIETAQSGWNSVTNAADADTGTADETDAELRIRREIELRRAGAAAVDAIQADVSSVDDVTSTTVFENTTNLVDGDGLPAKSFEAVVRDGAADDIAQALWESKAAGMKAYGSTSGTAVDSDGNNQTLEFSRPVDVPIYIDVTLTVDADTYPINGDDQVKTALIAYFAANQDTGDDLIFTRLYAPIYSVSGVLDVATLEVDTVSPPTGTSNIVINSRSLASLDSTNINVTS
jgi:uncharacterized phage protein gp47/JayE